MSSDKDIVVEFSGWVKISPQNIRYQYIGKYLLNTFGSFSLNIKGMQSIATITLSVKLSYAGESR